jgi:hypothetical protein
MQPVRIPGPPMTLQSTKGDGIAIKSTFTAYDDACPLIPGTVTLLRSLFSTIPDRTYDD